MANHPGDAGNALPLELVSALVDLVPQTLFFVKATDGRYLAANDAMGRFLGRASGRAVVGRPNSAFFPPATLRYFDTLDAAVIGRGRRLVDRFDTVTERQGDRTLFLFSRLPLRDRTGRTVAVLGLSRRLEGGGLIRAQQERVAVASAWLIDRLAEAFEAGALAAAAGVSRSQIERDFRRVLGTSPRRFLARQRIAEAIALIETDAPLAEIALACGYGDQSAFTRRFAAETGLAPSAFRTVSRDRREALAVGLRLLI